MKQIFLNKTHVIKTCQQHKKRYYQSKTLNCIVAVLIKICFIDPNLLEVSLNAIKNILKIRKVHWRSIF